MAGHGKIKSKSVRVIERHYTWTGGVFPNVPNTSALITVNGVTVRCEDDKLVVIVDSYDKWRLVHDAAARAVAIAVGGADIERVK